MNNMRNGIAARHLGWGLLLLAMACDGDRVPTSPDLQRSGSQPSFTVTYDNGWDGWMEYESQAESSIITCPTPISGIGPVPYQGRYWNSMNGPYVAVTRTLIKTRYRRANLLPIAFASLDGARAAADWFEVGCKPFLGIPTFDIATFVPGNWVVTYEPPPPDSGGGEGECETQFIYDPSQGCPGGGNGDDGGGSGGDDPGDGGGSGTGGGGTSCHTEYVFIEVSYDGGSTWSTWWEGYANVCE
jgi:hypothetical protein